MRVRLKQYRVAAGLTQAKLAAEVGVTQPTYQRWEAGKAVVPEVKLRQLAKILKTSPASLLSRHKPIEAAFYEDATEDAVAYYGEVAFHFAGGGDPLLLSISEEDFGSIFQNVQDDAKFFSFRSLANQTVIIRKAALLDIYFSSEAYDDYGPDHDTYHTHALIQIPDNRDWEIIEELSVSDEDEDIGGFSAEDIERVRRLVMITDDQFEDLLKQGRIHIDNLATEKEKNRAVTEAVFSLANEIKYQLSNGKQRSISCHGTSNKSIFYAFCEMIDYGDDSDVNSMILFESEGRHRVIAIGKGTFDYISIPSHRYDDGRVDADDETIGD